MTTPPTHGIDAPALLILQSDPAWDHERIGRERDEDTQARAAGETRPVHPVVEYWSGETRFDLEATSTYRGELRSVRSYLLPGSTPQIFEIRRLRPRAMGALADRLAIEFQRHEVRRENGETNAEYPPLGEIWCDFAERGVHGFDGVPVSFARRGERLTDACALALYDLLGPSGMWEVGQSVHAISRSLSDREKKV